MHDLLLKGGTVIDPAQNVNGALDVAIEGGISGEPTWEFIVTSRARRARVHAA